MRNKTQKRKEAKRKKKKLFSPRNDSVATPDTALPHVRKVSPVAAPARPRPPLAPTPRRQRRGDCGRPEGGAGRSVVPRAWMGGGGVGLGRGVGERYFVVYFFLFIWLVLVIYDFVDLVGFLLFICYFQWSILVIYSFVYLVVLCLLLCISLFLWRG